LDHQADRAQQKYWIPKTALFWIKYSATGLICSKLGVL